MLTLVAEIKVREGKAEEAKAAFRELMAAVRASEPGTLTYTIHQHKDDPLLFLAYERYQDEGALKTHMTNLGKHGSRLAGLLDGRPKATYLVDI